MAGRLVDRRGARMLMPLAFVHAGSVLAIWILGRADVAAALIVVPAVTAGASFPPAGALLRSRWPRLLSEPELVHGAYALDSVNIEVSFVTGPLITAVLVAIAGPELALIASAILVVAGTAWFVARLPAEHAGPPEVHHTSRLGPLADPAIRIVALTTLPIGFCLGAVEVALPAFATDHGEPALAGVLLAIWSAASGIGGLVFGVRGAGAGHLRMFLLMAVVFPLVCLPLVLATSAWTMVPLVILSGLPIAPLIASRNLLVGFLAPVGTGAESFTWLMTALVAGLAAGNAAAGALSQDHGWEQAVLVGCAVAAIGAGFAFAFRGTLRPRLATG
jgi:MFS family permease